MRGYRCEEWTKKDRDKNLCLPLRPDFAFSIVESPPSEFEQMVSSTLPVYLSDASLPRPDHKDRLSILAGSFKRLGVETPKVDFTKMKKILRFQRKFLFPEFQPLQELNLDTNKWIDNINHPERRKDELRKVYEEILKTGIFPRPGYDDPDPRDCESFIKDEPYPALKAHRWINSSHDKIKVLFGPLADACMHVLVGHPDFIKTIPVVERARVIYNDLGGLDGVCQSTDATSMEDHYARVPENNPMHRISNEFMLYLLGDLVLDDVTKSNLGFVFYHTTKHLDQSMVDTIWSELSSVTQMRLFFKGILDGYRRLKMRNFGHVLINSILCSGEMNTSFKNGVSMRCMVKYAAYYAATRKYKNPSDVLHSVRSTHSKHEGDDSIAVYPPGLAPNDTWWAEHGWVIKVEFVGKVNEASFCGLVFDEIDLQSVPDIRAALAKFGWTNRRYVHSSRPCHMSLLRSKALSMACEYGNVPILGHFAHRMLYLTRHVHIRRSVLDTMAQYDRDRFSQHLLLKPWEKPPEIGFGTRCLVERLQHISVSAQMLLEERFSQLELGPFVAPELEFDPLWIHNSTRCYESNRIPRNINIRGRADLCNHLIDKLNTECLWTEKLPKMIATIKKLSHAEI